jgi:acetyl-CoA carboxylase carboxyltransferase component
MIVANDATVKGGAYHPMTVKKQQFATIYEFAMDRWAWLILDEPARGRHGGLVFVS